MINPTSAVTDEMATALKEYFHEVWNVQLEPPAWEEALQAALAAQPAGEVVDATDWRKLAINLAIREADYRLNHDVHGDGHIKAGRAWDRMKRCGDAIREAVGLSTTPEPTPDVAELEKVKQWLIRYVGSHQAASAIARLDKVISALTGGGRG